MVSGEPMLAATESQKKSLFGRLRARSRSMANVHRERGNNFSSPMSKFASNVFGSLFARKQHDTVSSSANNETPDVTPIQDPIALPKETAVGNVSVPSTTNGDRFLSASHSHLNSVHAETDLDAFEGTSKMPSYVNISLAANGYSRSRTNLNTVLSRSGDVHNLIVNGPEVTDLTKEFKSVVFVNDKKNMNGSLENQTKNDSFTLEEFKIKEETVENFESFTKVLETRLNECVALADKALTESGLHDTVKEALLAAAGHTRILLKSKVKKMFQLLAKHKEEGGSETVTVNDLACFWQMLDIEVDNIRQQFNLVEKLRLNKWQPLPMETAESKPPICKTPSKRPGVPKLNSKITPKSEGTNKQSDSPRARTDMKAFLAQRRKELAEKSNSSCDVNFIVQ